VLLTDERNGYYQDYGTPLQDLARALGSGFVYQGEASAFRGGQLRGEASGGLPPTAFINFLQNHDQVGNRALGDRLEVTADARAIEAALAITLLAPMVPMLFMGEEWGSRRPFPFFCDFKGDLADAVRRGRRREYAWAYARYGDQIPDPLDAATFRSAVLDWSERDTKPGQDRLALVRRLLEVRARKIVPRLAGSAFGEAHASDAGLLTGNWRMGDGSHLRLMANLSAKDVAISSHERAGTPIWGGVGGGHMPPWSVSWLIGG